MMLPPKKTGGGLRRSSTPQRDEAIVLSESELNPKVVNGSAYDKGSVSAGGITRLEIPHDAVLQTGAPSGQVLIYLKKTLAFGGHPPVPISIAEGRRFMGVALRVQDTDAQLATYGEWDSRIEGGAFIRLLVRVPDGMVVSRTQGLSGVKSQANSDRIGLTEESSAWYGSRRPRSGWVAVGTQPDPDCVAKMV